MHILFPRISAFWHHHEPVRRPRNSRLSIEGLESRYLPATFAPQQVAYVHYTTDGQGNSNGEVDVYDPGAGSAELAGLPDTLFPALTATATGKLVVSQDGGIDGIPALYFLDPADPGTLQPIDVGTDTSYPGTFAPLPSGKIAFVHYTTDGQGNSHGEVDVYDPGAGSTKLAGLPDTLFPALTATATGKLILFQDGGIDGIPALYYLDPAKPTALKPIDVGTDKSNPGTFAPLPDGRIAYVHYATDRSGNSHGEIDVFDPSKGSAKRIIKLPDNLYPALTATATGKLVVSQDGGIDGFPALYFLDPAKPTLKPIDVGNDTSSPGGFAPLRSGKIAFVHYTTDGQGNSHGEVDVYDPGAGSTKLAGLPDTLFPALTATATGKLVVSQDGGIDGIPALYFLDPVDPGTLHPIDVGGDNSNPGSFAVRPSPVDIEADVVTTEITPTPGNGNADGQDKVSILDPSGDLQFKYDVLVPSLSKDISIKVYWAVGDDRTIPDLTKPLFTDTVKAGAKFGLSKPIKISKEEFLTAPPDATSLAIISDADNFELPNGDPNPDWVGEQTDIKVSTDLTADQLYRIMSSSSSQHISEDDAARLAPLLADAMAQNGITSLEQRAMFLGQLAHESNLLRTWTESGSDNYLISTYWLKTSRWRGLGLSRPTTSGLTLRVPHPSGKQPAQKAFDLYWSGGPTLDFSPTLIGSFSFKNVSSWYEAAFSGGVPPAHTSDLLVVDPATSAVVLAIENKLGNFQVKDVLDFRGRGPIQLTGRKNYEAFFDSGLAPPDLMTHPDLLSEKDTSPQYGIAAAGFYWSSLAKLNDLTDSCAGKSSYSFNYFVSVEINGFRSSIGGPNGLPERLSAYRRARSVLLEPPQKDDPSN
jgi:predicted chitinase